MITDQMIKAKVAQFPHFLTETGAKKILEHQEKNKQLYGESIYDKYYEAYEEFVSARLSGDEERIKKAKENMSLQFKHMEAYPQHRGNLE